MNEPIYLQACVQRVEEKLKWGDSREWTSSTFERLSEQIRDETKVTISPDTLKRLFGKKRTQKEFYNPQVATKDALAVFLGYKHWEDFKVYHYAEPAQVAGPIPAAPSYRTAVSSQADVPVSTLVELPVIPANRKTSSPVSYDSGKILVWIILTGVAGIIGASWWFMGDLDPSPKPSILFTSANAKGYAPYSVIFNYDVSQVKTDSIYIDYGYAYSTRLLPKDKKQIIHSYDVAGFYQTSIIADGKVLASLPVHLQTKGWETQVDEQSKYFIKPGSAIKEAEGRIHITTQEVDSLLPQKSRDFWVSYYNFTEYSAIGDNFTLETSLKNNSQDGGISCYDSSLEIFGENSIFRISLIKPGCGMYARAEISETIFNGEFQDLSALEQDLSQWRKVRLQVISQKLSVWLDSKLIFTCAYKKPVGQLKGIMFRFRGCGSVDYVKMFNQSHNLVYSEDFGNSL